MIQVITLLMLKRLHVDPLMMTLGVLKFQKTRVGLYALKGPPPNTCTPNLSFSPHISLFQRVVSFFYHAVNSNSLVYLSPR